MRSSGFESIYRIFVVFYAGPSIFGTVLADAMPKGMKRIYGLLRGRKQEELTSFLLFLVYSKWHQLPSAHYLPDWLIPQFLDRFGVDASAHTWGVSLLEGGSLWFISFSSSNPLLYSWVRGTRGVSIVKHESDHLSKKNRSR